MIRFCLAIPESSMESIRAIITGRGLTVTSYIRGAVNARLQADLSGQRFCSSGEPCILALLPNMQAHAKTAESILNRGSLFKSGG